VGKIAAKNSGRGEAEVWELAPKQDDRPAGRSCMSPRNAVPAISFRYFTRTIAEQVCVQKREHIQMVIAGLWYTPDPRCV